MPKRFNDTGLCIPERHYMADTSAKLAAILEMVEDGAYFVINRPRQYGKTTMIHHLFLALKNRRDYLAIQLSFEGIGDSVFEEEAVFCQNFVNNLAHRLRKTHPAHTTFLHKASKTTTSLNDLSRTIEDFVEYTGKNVVLMIDEIDKASNNQLFLSFLGMLRDKYLDARKELDTTFQSVILAGVHDIKSLKLKISLESKGKLNSPWNIAVDFRVDMSFNPQEIEYMLTSYVRDRGVVMDTGLTAEKIYYYTSGYPYLVSKLCKFVDEDVLPQKQDNRWELSDLEAAFKLLTYGGYTNTLFDSLIKHLENDPELYQMIFDISINGAFFNFNVHAPLVNKALKYGMIRDDHGRCMIHNRVIEQKLYGYFLAKQETENGTNPIMLKQPYYTNDGLHLPEILRRFQQFMQENYSHKDVKFLEREGRLLFLSFLKPIINGKGFDFKEPNISEERRMDIVISFGIHRYVVELKHWEGEAYHQKGLGQLSAYLDTYSLKEGFLLIFDFRKSKEYKQADIQYEDKEIFAVWV